MVVHDTSPTARALLVLEMVQNAPGISADRLAERLGLSDRAVRRHVGGPARGRDPGRVDAGAVRRLPRSAAGCGCRR